MSKRLSARMAAWLNENQGKHHCGCGCGQPIPVAKHHFTYGVAKFLRGHNLNAPTTSEEKFWSHVEKTEGCWLWKGSTACSGYGRINLGRGVRVQAHRYSYELHISKPPSDLFVCHKCDNRRCVNPAHLFLGTAADNAADAVSKNRLPSKRGEKNGRAKLTIANVKEIRRMVAAGSKLRDVAKQFGVTHGAVWQIKTARAWGDVS